MGLKPGLGPSPVKETGRPRLPLTGVKKDELGTALGDIGEQRPPMRYHWFRQRGLFTGSGVAEADCKTVPVL